MEVLQDGLKYVDASTDQRIIRGLNGMGQGLMYIFRNYGNSLPEVAEPRSGLQRQVDIYRRLLFESLHYRLELGMYSYSALLILQDMFRRTGNQEISKVLREVRKPSSPHNVLHSNLDDYLLLGYAYDDLLDNSPLRGNIPAYHLTTSSSLVEDMYWHTRGKLIDAIRFFSEDGATELDKL